ncbi:MAG TPA: crosslink repair DNA glycosylase YcaQ family protein [Burkholderiales bacterium]|nr:crosslink repair DNA glycosylase YcaQ family protein [Burkholderiales bacterium]
MLPEITAAQARRLVLSRQGLVDRAGRRLTAAGVAELVERLGFLQVDSISTVARAHHMILFARDRRYRPELLRRALEAERRLFEHWTHDVAAILPMRFYPYWRLRFERERHALERRFRRWHGDAHQDELERVLDLVRANGPVMARDLASERARPAGGWWDWHLGKTALEFLWRTGRLAIARREGFQKVYDLAERVIPDAVRQGEADHAALVDWACREALERLVVASPGELARFFGLVTIEEAKGWSEKNLGRAALPVRVASANGAAPRRLLARPDFEVLLADLPEPPARVRVLSPFDPLLRDRARLERLFAFDYRIEVFVPAARRAYGYYVFPLLERDALVGRIDMRAERAAGVLQVDALWMEPGRRLTRIRMRRIEAELERIRRFVGLDAVRFANGYLKRDG